MSDITKYTITSLKQKLNNKEISATELTKLYLDKIKQINSELNAYILSTEEIALKSAAISDQNIANGSAKLLEGIPLGIKDNFCTKNIKTRCASHILDNFIPPYESTVTQNLWNNGAILLGKLNMEIGRAHV